MLKKIIALMLCVVLSVVFVSCGSDSNTSETTKSERSNSQIQQQIPQDTGNNQQTIESPITQKTPIGTWTEPTWFIIDDSRQKYKADDPFVFKFEMTSSKGFSINTTYDDVRVRRDEFIHDFEYGSWKKDREDDTHIHYNLYVEGGKYGELDFDRNEGSLTVYIDYEDKIIYYGSYECKIEGEPII